MGGNVLIRDKQGIFVKQGYLAHTSRGNTCVIETAQCANIQCRLSTRVSKQVKETKTHITKTFTNVFQIHSSFEQSAAVVVKHFFKGSLLTNSLEAAEGLV